MAWSYSGDPNKSELDRYRFLISDTDPEEPVLQDEEVEFLLKETEEHNVRLYLLFDKAADMFARHIKQSLGPQSEDPTERMKHFRAKANYYRRLTNNTVGGFSVPSTKAVFKKGMHDNV